MKNRDNTTIAAKTCYQQRNCAAVFARICKQPNLSIKGPVNGLLYERRRTTAISHWIKLLYVGHKIGVNATSKAPRLFSNMRRNVEDAALCCHSASDDCGCCCCGCSVLSPVYCRACCCCFARLPRGGALLQYMCVTTHPPTHPSLPKRYNYAACSPNFAWLLLILSSRWTSSVSIIFGQYSDAICEFLWTWWQQVTCICWSWSWITAELKTSSPMTMAGSRLESECLT